jgi:hypothetical protein
MPAYSAKSEPPPKAIKEMMAKHSEDSSKDLFQRAVRHGKMRAKKMK